MAKELTLAELVAKRRAAGDDRYQYTDTSGGPIKQATFTAICPTHGEFTAGVYAHLAGSSCRKCAYEANGLAKRVSLEVFEVEASKVHQGKYTYTALVYGNKGSPVVHYTCPIHGSKSQSASNHKKGAGCPDCGIDKIRESKQYTLASFTLKASEVHGEKYTYKALHFDKADITYVEYECPEHGIHKQGLSSHLRGQGCPTCFAERRGLQLRYSLKEYAKAASEKHGLKFEYVSLNYETLPATVTYTCPEHGEQSQGMSSHLSGKGCPSCFEARRGQSLRTPLSEFIAKAQAVHGKAVGYVYRSLDHEGPRTMVRYTCPTHGEVHQSGSNHLNGTGCPSCGYVSRGLNSRYCFEDYVDGASKIHGRKYTYSKLDYENGGATIAYSCPQHGEQRQLASDHMEGTGCRKCGFEVISKLKRFSFEDFIVEASNAHLDKYLYVGLTFEDKSIVHYICPKHGMHSQSASSHLGGAGCPRCSNLISKPSVEIKDYIESLGLGTKQEHRFPDTRKAVDIIVPSLRLAVEYNGNYWHTTEYVESRYHKLKTNLARDNGYRMLHIWSHEWLERRSAVENLLRHACGKQTHSYSSKTAEVVTPSTEEARLFLNTNHLQGAPVKGSYLGLMQEGELCSIVCFNHNTTTLGQMSNVAHVEVTRFSTTMNECGGLEKLLQEYLATHPETLTVVSYSDERISDGQTYFKAGFVKMHTTKPSYQYLEKNAVSPRHKSNYQKSKLINRFGEEFCKGKTEREITEQNQIYRIYDCGLTKWVYSVNPTQL